MFFRAKPVLDQDRVAWVTDRMGWLARTFGHEWLLGEATLVLPTKDFITAGRGEDQATAEAVLADVKRWMYMEDWPVALLAMPELPEGMGHSYQALSEAAGTFQIGESEAVIRYRPSMLRTPVPFISTLSHELAHYLLAPHWQDLPGGEDEHELLTDLTAIATGFGIFQMMTADAWGWAGYLSQETRAFALALYLRASDQDPDSARPHLANRPLKLYHRALAQLASDDGPVRAIGRD